VTQGHRESLDEKISDPLLLLRSFSVFLFFFFEASGVTFSGFYAVNTMMLR